MNFEKWRARAEKRDVIYREKIHADEEKEEVLPKKGIVDVPMLLITAALLLFGCVMVYSASSIYAEQYHNDTTYFIARHLFFILAGVGVAALAAAFCTPRFWKDWSYLIFGLSVVLYFAISFAEELFTDAVKMLTRVITLNSPWTTLILNTLFEILIVSTVFVAMYCVSLYLLKKRFNIE